MQQKPELKGFLHLMGTKWSHCQEKVYANIIEPEIIKQLSYYVLGVRVLILKDPVLSHLSQNRLYTSRFIIVLIILGFKIT